MSHLFKEKLFREKVLEAKRKAADGSLKVLFVFDVDNCLYHTGKKINYEEIIDINILRFFGERFRLDEGSSRELQTRLQGIGKNYTVAGLKTLFDNNPNSLGILQSGTKEDKKLFLEAPDIRKFTLDKPFSQGLNPAELLTAFTDYVWDIKPSAENMTFDPNLVDELVALKEMGVVLVAHSNSAVCGVKPTLQHILGERVDVFDDLIFGVDSFDYQPKPFEASYVSLFNALQERSIDTENMLKIFIDDSLTNVMGADKFYDFTIVRGNTGFRLGSAEKIEAAFKNLNNILGVAADNVEGVSAMLREIKGALHQISVESAIGVGGGRY